MIYLFLFVLLNFLFLFCYLTFGLFGFTCKWKYRNPADRTCVRCNRNQNNFEYYGDPKNTRWEDMNIVPKACGLSNLMRYKPNE